MIELISIEDKKIIANNFKEQCLRDSQLFRVKLHYSDEMENIINYIFSDEVLPCYLQSFRVHGIWFNGICRFSLISEEKEVQLEFDCDADFADNRLYTVNIYCRKNSTLIRKQRFYLKFADSTQETLNKIEKAINSL